MKKFMSFMEDKVAPIFAKLATNPYLTGIKDGMIADVYKRQGENCEKYICNYSIK